MNQYCLPEEPSGEFVYQMKDALDMYTRPYETIHVVRRCLDEPSVDRRKANAVANRATSTGSPRLRISRWLLDDFFLERPGWKILCQGSRADVHPFGMDPDMGSGTHGQPGALRMARAAGGSREHP